MSTSFIVINVADENMEPWEAILIFSLLIFTCLFGIFIALLTLWRICYKNAMELKNVDSITIHSAVSCIVLHSLTLILDPIGYFFFMTNDNSNANIVWLIWDILWTASKLNLYFVYIYRCYITFKDTKYAYSPSKVYTPLALAWILQLCNMVIFMLYDLGAGYDSQTDPSISPRNNPFSDDNILVIAASLYIIFDFFIVLGVVFLFLNPIIRLMSDLKSQSEQKMIIIDVESSEIEMEIMETNNLVQNQDTHTEDSISSTDITAPHSPTKMGAAYYNKQKKQKIPLTPRTMNSNSLRIQQMKSSNTAETTTIDTKLKMKHFGRLPCPEDEMKELETLKPVTELKEFTPKYGGIIWSDKQIQILNTGTRLALLCIVSLSSGFIYQALWIISVQGNVLGYFNYSWGIDTVINIVCIYLSFQFTAMEYNILCQKCCLCNCHKCCFKMVGNMAKRYHISQKE